MKKIYILLFISVLATFGYTKGTTPPDITFFSTLNGVDSAKLIRNTEYGSRIYELWFRQCIDHNNPEFGHFPQRVLFEHRDFDLPVVVVIEGYSIYSTRLSEPAKLLNANQLTIEHRFFAQSRPADSIPWGKLNMFNAANDQHAVIQTFKPFYKSKWVSTGISKGGQAVIFHRFFFPDDVDASIPYVAPVNYSNKDERVFLFLDTVGTPECRQRIFNFQIELFERKQQLMSNFRQEIAAKNWSFPMSVDSAYDLSVLEFSFAWWQWGNGRCNEIPEATAHDTILYAYFSKSGAAEFFTLKGIEENRPFFFQAMTEIGMYGYQTSVFENYTSFKGVIGFEFTLPEGYRNAQFNPEPMKEVDEWMKTKGNNMLYIYGAYDAWSSTAAQPGISTNSSRFFNPSGNHGSRIISFPEQMQDSIVRLLGDWLELRIIPPYKN